jgi:hypothetical protein
MAGINEKSLKGRMGLGEDIKWRLIHSRLQVAI